MRTQHDDTDIKLFVALPRRSAVSEQQFHDHWRHPHGSLGLTIELGVHYVQGHRVATPWLGEGQTVYEGICEIWMRNIATASQMPTHPEYLRLLKEDEPRFIDMNGIRFLFTQQTMVYDTPEAPDEADRAWSEARRPTAVKLIQLFPPGHAETNDHERVRSGRAIGAYQHAVCRPIAALHAGGATFGEVREYWWPTLSVFQAKAANAPREILEPVGATSVLVIAERYR